MADDFDRRVYDRTHDILGRLESRGVEVSEFAAKFARSAAEQMERFADDYAHRLPGDSTPPSDGVG